MDSSVTAGLRSPVAVLLTVVSCLLSLFALWFANLYGFTAETALSSFAYLFALLAPISGSLAFLGTRRAVRPDAATYVAVSLAPSLSLAVPILLAGVDPGIALAFFAVFFSRSLLSANLSAVFFRSNKRAVLSAAVGFGFSVVGWTFLSAVADGAILPVGGFVSASQGLIPVSETLAGCVASLAFRDAVFLRGVFPRSATSGPLRRASLIFLSMLLALSFVHQDATRDRRSSVSEQGRALLGRLDSEFLFTLYPSNDDAVSRGDLSRIRHLLSGYERKGGGFFRREEAERIPAAAEARVPVAEYRGSFRELPPADSPSAFERDLCVSIADLLGDDVVPEVLLRFGNDLERGSLAARELSRRGVRVIEGDIPESRIEGLVVVATSVTREEEPRLRSYLDSGGAALFLAAGVSCDVSSSWVVTARQADPLAGLLADYGVTLSKDVLRSPRGPFLRMPALDGSGIVSVRYPYWVRAVVPKPRAEKNGRGPRVLFSGVQSPLFLWPSRLDVTERPGIRSRVLLVAENGSRPVVTPVDASPFSASGTVPDDGRSTDVIRDDGLSVSPAPLLVSLSVNGREDSIIVLGEEHALGKAASFADTAGTRTLVLNVIECLSGKDAYSAVRRGGIR